MILRRLLPIAVLVCAIGLFGVYGTGSAAATALPMGQCSTTSGVVVAVDFGHWGGPIVRSCGSTPTSGWQLVNQGGLATQGTGHDGPAFICKIGYSGFRGGIGEPADQTCSSTPPTNASWSYWIPTSDQSSWTLAPEGAADSYPAGGAVQAWTFGDQVKPSFSPDSVRAQNSTPSGGSTASRSSTPPTSKGSPAPYGRGSGVPYGRGSGLPASRGSSVPYGKGSSGSAVASSPLAGQANRTGTPTTTTAGAANGTATNARIVDAQPEAASRPKRSGSYLPLLAVLGAVLVLAALAGWQRRRVR